MVGPNHYRVVACNVVSVLIMSYLSFAHRVTGIFADDVQRALRAVLNWHKYATQLEFTDDDLHAMQREAQQ